MLTGLLPVEHGIRDNVSPAVVGEVPLLAELLREQGFATAAFVSSVVLSSQSGLSRGFDVYSDRFEGVSGDAQFLNTVQKKGADTISEALGWLEANRQKRTFLWLHLYEPHDPYEPPEPYASRYKDRPYDGEVAFVDELVGRFDDRLAALGLKERTALVVTSDHGEGLGEHGEMLHGFFAYQTTLRVPFLVRGPGIRAGTRLRSTVQLVDVFPTLIDLAELPRRTGLTHSGRSLDGALRHGRPLPEAASYAETLVPLLQFGWSDLRVVRDGRWKYIQAPRPELYDLQADPAELRDLASAQPSRAQALRAGLARILDRERAARKGPAAAGPSQDLIEKLGALGYVGAGGAAETSAPGADPKDKIEEFRVVNSLIREALLAFHAGQPAASVEKLRRVLARGVRSFEVHYYLARALFAQGRYAEAGPNFEEAARRSPSNAAAWEGAAECRLRRGDVAGALARLREGEAAAPSDAALRVREGQVLREQRRLPEARRALESAVTLAPRNASLRVQLGELLREMGQPDEAVTHLQVAVDVEPEKAGGWNTLGMTLGGLQRMAEAEKAFREAYRLDGKNPHHAYNLGLALQRQGRPEEARPYFEKTLALAPGFTPARQRLTELRK